MTTAGFFRRIFADILDSLFLCIFAIVFFIFISLYFGVVPEIVSRALGMVLSFFYFSLLESSKWQRTLGQRCLNIYVCTVAYQRLSFGRAVFREITRSVLIGGVMISVGCLFGFLLVRFGTFEQASSSARFVLIGLLYLLSIMSAIVVYYVRFFNNRRQTLRDYLTGSMMMVTGS